MNDENIFFSIDDNEDNLENNLDYNLEIDNLSDLLNEINNHDFQTKKSLKYCVMNIKLIIQLKNYY